MVSPRFCRKPYQTPSPPCSSRRRARGRRHSAPGYCGLLRPLRTSGDCEIGCTRVQNESRPQPSDREQIEPKLILPHRFRTSNLKLAYGKPASFFSDFGCTKSEPKCPRTLQTSAVGKGSRIFLTGDRPWSVRRL